MFIPDPDFYPSRISDPRSKISNKREGLKKFVLIPFYVATNFTFLPIKLSLSYQKHGFGIRDPGSGKKLFRIPNPGVKRHRIRVRNTVWKFAQDWRSPCRKTNIMYVVVLAVLVLGLLLLHTPAVEPCVCLLLTLGVWQSLLLS
jgi:hypothetical protein